MIVDAVIPLLLEYGRGIMTKQIAERAGIAEGTLCRAFETKSRSSRRRWRSFSIPSPSA